MRQLLIAFGKENSKEYGVIDKDIAIVDSVEKAWNRLRKEYTRPSPQTKDIRNDVRSLEARSGPTLIFKGKRKN
jgi:hypothetical protein